jgi:hypothetical protein
MPPIPHASTPRIVLYHQTVNDPAGNPISILPLITRPGIAITHIIVAAIHINEDANAITLNDHHPSDPRYITLWAELRIAQASGVSVLGMLGGAAKGSYTRLDKDLATFEAYYGPVRDMIRERGLNGLDLDVEEEMSLSGVVRLIDRLRSDFGPGFVITLAPVAAALLDARRNLSGFDYAALELMRGKEIAWYNAQFYCGWGDASNPFMYEMCIAKGWAPEKVVIGLVTTPENGAGFIPWEMIGPNLRVLKRRYEKFGGVMGWEYFNSSPGGKVKPWEWAQRMTMLLRGNEDPETREGAGHGTGQKSSSIDRVIKPLSLPTKVAKSVALEADPDKETSAAPPVPGSFTYYSEEED